VFVATRVSIYAFDATNGTQLWRRTDLLAPHDFSEVRQPTTGAGAVFVTNRWGDNITGHGAPTHGATTYALDPATGATRATYDGGTDLPPFVSDDGWVYLADAVAPQLNAYGPHGERFTVSAPMGVQDVVGDADTVRFVSGVAVQTISPHGCGQPTCAALHTDTVPGGRGTPTRLAENSHTVFVLHEGMLYAYPRNGCGAAVCDAAWSSRSYMGDINALVATDDAVYVTASGAMRVFDAGGCDTATCTPRWKSALDPSDTVRGPMLANGVLVASVYGNGLVGLAAWDASGCGTSACAPTWTLPSGVSEHPIISDGALYFLVKTGFGAALRRLAPAT
jgi:outer membrane protein assembly factor BamB